MGSDFCCRCIGCANCSVDLASCLKIVMSGWANGSCSLCDCMNNTFYLPKVGDCQWGGGSDCWACPDLGSMWADMVKDGSDYKLRFRMNLLGPTAAYEFAYNFGTSKPDCRTFSNLTLAHVDDSGTCDGSSAVVVATAVHGDDCPEFNDICGICADSPSQFEVTISGVGANPYNPFGCYGGDCTAWNDTYVLDVNEPSCCAWRYTFGTAPCPSMNNGAMTLALIDAGSNLRLSFGMLTSGLGAYASATKDITWPKDCASLDEIITTTLWSDAGDDCYGGTVRVRAL